MLEQLAKNHDEWLKIAYRICQCTEQSKDMVQDMYLKMHECDKPYEEINKWFIYRVMFNAFLNSIKKRKVDLVYVDNYFRILKQEDNDLSHLEMLQCMDDALNEVGLIDKRYLIETHTRSLRKNEEYLGIHFMTLHYRKKRALERLKETDKIKDFKKNNE